MHYCGVDRAQLRGVTYKELYGYNLKLKITLKTLNLFRFYFIDGLKLLGTRQSLQFIVGRSRGWSYSVVVV